MLIVLELETLIRVQNLMKLFAFYIVKIPLLTLGKVPIHPFSF